MKIGRRLLIYTLSFTIVLLGLVACREDPPATTETAPAPTQSTTTGDNTEIAVMLRHDGQHVNGTSDMVGILGVRNGCIRVDVPDADDIDAVPTSYLTIWPPDYALERAGQAILLYDNEGRPVGRIGEFIWIAGVLVDDIPDDLQSQLPPNCPGPYLYVTGASPEIPF